MRQLITNTGFGTGVDWRPNPGIGFPGWANYFPVTRAVPEPPSIRNLFGGPAPGPIPYPGAPPYGAPMYAPDGTPLWPGLPPAPPPGAPKDPGPRPGPNPSWCPRPPDYRTVTADSNPAGGAHHPDRHQTRTRKATSMSTNWRHALWRLGIFLGVCLLGVFALYAVFAQLRFGEKTTRTTPSSPM